MTDVDVLAVRFPSVLHHPGAADPLLEVDPRRIDVIIGEVKQGRAHLNPGMHRTMTIEHALGRIGCCAPEEMPEAARRIASGHDLVLKHALPAVARAVSSNPEAYLYLAESIRAWPAQPALAQRIWAAGWTDVAWRNLAGGAVALHRLFLKTGAIQMAVTPMPSR